MAALTGCYGRRVLPAAALARLREAFGSASYTVEAVVEAIGEEAHRALGRNSTVPARRALRGRDDPLALLTRLWLLQEGVSRRNLDRTLPGLAEPLLAAGILATDVDRVWAEIDIRPYATDDGPLWVASDLTPGLDGVLAPSRPDFVLGVSSASATLAQLTVRTPVGRALDLGTGCGVQSLHLARHAGSVVATDVNPRALALARLTLELNRAAADLRLGSLYEPVAAETFDLIVSNPPYVMAPPTRTPLAYREGTMPADALVEHVVRRGAERLADGGVLQVLGNWAHPSGADWKDRLHRWLEPTGCDAHVVQREVLEPSAYVELWLADAGLTSTPGYVGRYEEWLDYLAGQGVAAVGMGWVTVRRAGRSAPRVRIEDWPYPVEQPIGPAFAAEFEAADLLAPMSDAELLRRSWVLAADVTEETRGRPGQAHPEHIVFRRQRGFRRAVEVDTALAGVLGACDGELSLGRITVSVAALLGVPAAALTAEVLPRVRDLVLDGFLRDEATLPSAG